jgi:hypothetical protein
MSQSTIPVVAPSYLSPRCLPYVSDIFYHDRIIYFGPTGIHPLEWHAVAGFPEYCRKQQIALPQLIWEMTNAYFENSRLAVKAADILRPLQPQLVLIVVAVYDRDEVAIQKAKKMLQQRRDLIDLFERTSFELPFPSRELLSHLFLDLFMQRGYEGVIEYLREETHSPDRFIQLLVAVLLNRFRLFAGRESSLLLYEHSWYPFLLRACSIQQASVVSTSQDTTDPQEVEHLCYKLFETILLPLFGRVDSPDKAEEVAKISSDRSAEIVGMKTECRRIARDIVTSGTEDSSLKEEILRDAIQERISEPLAALLAGC